MNPRLYWTVWSLETRRSLAYRTDFWLQMLASFAAQLLVAVFLWEAVFEARGGAPIAGYDQTAMIGYYLTVLLVGRVVRGTDRPITMATEIYEGTLSRYLLYPAPYLAVKYAEHLGTLLPGLIQLAIGGAVALALLDPGSGAGLLGAVSVGSVLRAALAIAVANLLSFLLHYPLQGVAFWAENVWSLNVMLRFTADLLGGLMLPLAIFPGWAQELLSWLPFAYLFSFPVTVLLGQVDDARYLAGLATALAWCAVFALVGRAVWRRGLASYAGAGI
jgi:ABC-2 type transport system permease protein